MLPVLLVQDNGKKVNKRLLAEISSEDEEVDELVIHKGKAVLVGSSGEDDVLVGSSGEDDRSIELDEFEALDEEQQEYEALGVQEHTNSIDDDAALYYEDYVSSDDEDYVLPRGSLPRGRKYDLGQCNEEQCYHTGTDSDEADDVPSDPDDADEIILNSDEDEELCKAEGYDHAEFVLSTANIYQEEDVDDDLYAIKVPPDLSYVGMSWKKNGECSDYLRDLAIQKHFSMQKIVSNAERREWKYKSPGCSWRVNCNYTNEKASFSVKSGHLEHSCKRLGLKNPMANARWVALRIMRYVKDHVQCKPSTIKRRVKRKYKVKISYWTAWHARHICLERIFGSYEKSYGQVPELCRQIMEANPGSIATWSKDTVHRQFEGLFVMYKASLDGFLNGCRSIIGLDGTFLKGKYGGMVLAAMGLDINNGIFPIAIYICRNECKETWNKFLSILAPYVTRHEQPLTFISDQQKGLIDGVARQFAQFNHYHRFCFRHLYKNFKKKFPGSHLETLVWRAAKSYNEIDYKHWMKEVAEYDPAAVTWLEKHPLEEWTRWKFDHTSRCEHISNNFSESFNSWILELRHLPICKFVMEYEKLVMETLYSREKKGQGWCQTGLINRAEERLKGHRGNVHFLNCYPSTENVWLVENGIEMTWKVNLTRKECNCGAWQVGGVPCIHAMAVIVEKDENAYSYADPCHLISKYMMTYDGHVEPTANPLTWLEVEDVFKVNPPRVVRPAGRPRNLRRRDRDEADGNTRNQKRCGICKIYGHNRAGCEGAKDGDPSTIGVNIIYGPHVRRPHNEDGDGITTSAETGSSSRPQRTNAGMRITRFGITTNSSRPTNGGVLRGGIPPMAAVRGRGGRVGARGAGRGRASGSGGAVRGRGNVVVGAVRGRGGRAEVVGGRGIGSTAAAGTQSSQTSTITVQSTRGRGTESVASYARMRGGETRFPSYPVENMTRRSASLMGLIEDQPPVKRGKQAKKGAAVHWY